jgi:hypothetical protein
MPDEAHRGSAHALRAVRPHNVVQGPERVVNLVQGRPLPQCRTDAAACRGLGGGPAGGCSGVGEEGATPGGAASARPRVRVRGAQEGPTAAAASQPATQDFGYCQDTRLACREIETKITASDPPARAASVGGASAPKEGYPGACTYCFTPRTRV